MTQPTTTPSFRYVDEDDFCLSARLLPQLPATLSITIEGSDEPQSAHVPVGDLPQVLAGIAAAAGLPAPVAAPTTAPPAPHSGLLRTAADRTPDPATAALLRTLADAADHRTDATVGLMSTVLHPAVTLARHILDTESTAPPVDTDLRDRIRRAICEASGFTWLPDELMEPDEYGEHADAVLAVLRRATQPEFKAVLPAPAEVCICGHTEAQHFEDCCQVCDCGTFLVPEAAREMITHLHAAVLRLKAAAPTDRAVADQPADRRATTLREAAALLSEIGTPIFGERSEHERGLMYGAERLRRLADEAQQPETEGFRAWLGRQRVHGTGTAAAIDETAVTVQADEAQQPTTAPAEHVHRLGNPDDDGILDDWDNCRDPQCPGPATPAPSEEPTP